MTDVRYAYNAQQTPRSRKIWLANKRINDLQ